MGALMKEALAETGGRGGGSKDMAQGGPERVQPMAAVLGQLQQRVIQQRS
jgi:alanyl-tRNA synthetase